MSGVAFAPRPTISGTSNICSGGEATNGTRVSSTQLRRRGLLAGESTPSYAILDEAIFRRIRSLNSEVKLIFVMRDPVDRAWSTVTNAHRKDRLKGLSLEETLAGARSKKVASRSMYLDTIKRVEFIFPPQQLFCDLRRSPRPPEKFVADVLSFLGVELNPTSVRLLPEAVNSTGKSTKMPPEFARTLAKQYLPVVQELSKRFEGPPHRWSAKYDALLSSTDRD